MYESWNQNWVQYRSPLLSKTSTYYLVPLSFHLAIPLIRRRPGKSFPVIEMPGSLLISSTVMTQMGNLKTEKPELHQA